MAEIARAASAAKTYNNLSISNSNIGVVSTGNLAKISAAITITTGNDHEEFGARLKDLTEAIVNEASVSADLKQQMVEIVQAISEQVVASKKPSNIVIATLFARLKEMATNSTVIIVAAEKLQAAWSALSSIL